MTERTPDVIVNSIAPVLCVRDIDAALARFEAMGFVGRAYEHDGEPFYGFVCMGPTEFHITREKSLKPEKNTSAVYLYVDDADAVFARWRDAVDGRFVGPSDTEYGLREFGYVDPDGNLFRVGSELGD